MLEKIKNFIVGLGNSNSRVANYLLACLIILFVAGPLAWKSSDLPLPSDTPHAVGFCAILVARVCELGISLWAIVALSRHE